MKPIVLLAVLAACGGPSDDEPTPLPTRDLGDVVPRVLYARATPGIAGGLAQVSMPVSPRDPVLTPKPGGERLVFHGAFERVESTRMPGAIEVPVDTVGADSWLYIQPSVAGDALKEALADIQVFSPTGEQIHEGDGAMQLIGLPAGVYKIIRGERAQRYGMTVELAQPNSPIKLALQTTSVVHFPGDPTTVAISLSDGGTPLAGVHVSAELITPDGESKPGLGVIEAGRGNYSVPVAPIFRLDDPTGMYSIRVTAEGSTLAGVRFSKSGTVAVRYTVPTARITEVMPARMVRRGDRGIEAFEVDVRVEVASTDRYEISGLLAGTYDGKVRRICAAQTADVLDPGEQTVTLRFDAGLVKLTGLQGSFHLEQLQLFSQGRGELLHRIPKGLTSIRTADVKRADLIELQQRTPAIDEMIGDGMFSVE